MYKYIQMCFPAFWRPKTKKQPIKKLMEIQFRKEYIDEHTYLIPVSGSASPIHYSV